MAQPKQVLRLVHAPKSFCDVMVHANVALSNHKTDEAIQQYNRVLYTLAPAHTCAFLNRCMAWIESGYYELAVMDACRALVTATELGKVRNSPATTHPPTNSVRVFPPLLISRRILEIKESLESYANTVFFTRILSWQTNAAPK